MKIDFRSVTMELRELNTKADGVFRLWLWLLIFLVFTEAIDGCNRARISQAGLHRADVLRESVDELAYSVDRLNTTLVKAHFSTNGLPEWVRVKWLVKKHDYLNATNLYIQAVD